MVDSLVGGPLYTLHTRGPVSLVLFQDTRRWKIFLLQPIIQSKRETVVIPVSVPKYTNHSMKVKLGKSKHFNPV